MKFINRYDKKKILVKTIKLESNFLLTLIFILVQSLFFYTSLGLCGIISISTMTNISYFDQTKNETILNLIIKNLGNEAAIDSRIEIISDYFIGDSIYIGDIKPNEEKNIEIRLVNKNEISVGSYYVGMLIKYKDANNYEFSLVTFGKVINKIDYYPKVYAHLDSISILREGNMKLKIYNPEEEKKVKITLFFPKEFSLDNYITETILPKNKEKEFYFKIKNLKALVGSNYFVFALLEEEKELEGKRIHGSLAVGANIRIVENFYSGDSENKLEILSRLPLLIKISLITIVILLFLFSYFSLKERMKEKRGEEN